MEIEELTVLVRPDGTVKLEVRGVKGERCLEVTQDIEQLLGGQVIERLKTPEADESAEAHLTGSLTNKLGA